MKRLALCLLWLALSAQADERRSGRDTMSPALQAMAADANPAQLWVQQGRELWAAGPRACQSCHGGAEHSMRGVVARFPAWVAGGGAGRVMNLAQRVQQCRVERQGLPAWPPESEPLLALTAFVAAQSRGLPLAPPATPALDAAAAQGRALWGQRMGALNLSCAQCHDERAGQRLGGSLIPQGHVEDYPLYRLEWQSLGSLQRRLRNCASGVRAQVWDWDAPELLALEVYLARRSGGMPMQSPGLRP